MQIIGQATRVTVYFGESDTYQGRPLYLALLEMLKREGASGATIMRGVAGFGAHSRIHTASLITLSADLPMDLVWVDDPRRVERLLPRLRSMVDAGLITTESVDVVQYAPGRQTAPLDGPVVDIMREEVVTVAPHTPVAEIMALLLHRELRSVPVVDDQGRVVGIITDGDLLRRANLMVRLGLQEELSAAAVQEQLTQLRESGLTAADIMTQPAITVRVNDSVRQAALIMDEKGLKRLPVVDEQGRLTGWISRIDLFRVLDYHFIAEPNEQLGKTEGLSVSELMITQVATVPPGAGVEAVLHALEQNNRRRVVVVDEQRRVLGIITDKDILRRSRLRSHPTLLSRIQRLLGVSTGAHELLPPSSERAMDLMSTPVISVRPDTPLSRALHLMIQHNIKRLPVVDNSGVLLGLLGRNSVLRGLLNASPPDLVAPQNGQPA